MGLFHVIRESLLNVQRHSGSRRARVRMLRDQENVVLEVSDQGCGIPADRLSAHTGVGIRSMEERVKQAGGVFTLESNHQGTRVVVKVPIYA